MRIFVRDARNNVIILLYGPDTYRARQKLHEIVAQHKKLRKSGLNLRYFDLIEDNPEQVLDWLKQAPMFKERKLAVLKNAAQFVAFFEKFSSSREHTLLFFEQSQTLINQKEIKAQKFDYLEGRALRRWIKDEFAKYGAQPDVVAVEKLIKFVGNDSWRLANEIKKLSAYKISTLTTTSSVQSIKSEDVELLVRSKIDTDIFETVRALAFGNKKRALGLVQKHLEKGDNPLYLLSMISWQFRQLLLKRKSGFFSRSQIKAIFQKILETDLAVKTGKIDPEAALCFLILAI